MGSRLRIGAAQRERNSGTEWWGSGEGAHVGATY